MSSRRPPGRLDNVRFRHIAVRAIGKNVGNFFVYRDSQRVVLARTDDSIHARRRIFALREFPPDAQLRPFNAIPRANFSMDKCNDRFTERNTVHSTVFLQKPHAVAGAIATLVGVTSGGGAYSTFGDTLPVLYVKLPGCRTLP